MMVVWGFTFPYNDEMVASMGGWVRETKRDRGFGGKKEEKSGEIERRSDIVKGGDVRERERER